MTAQRTRALWGFVGVACVLLAVLSWLTFALLHLDYDERGARQQAALQERLRLALWRMDSWLSPQLAREAMRPPSDYRAFPSAAAAWTKGFSRIGPDEVVVPSPLLGVESPLFPLHFEFRAEGLSSPQVPIGNQRDVAEANQVDGAVIDRAQQRLERLRARLALPDLIAKVGGAELRLPLLGCSVVAPGTPTQMAQSVQELANRQLNARSNYAPVDNNPALAQTAAGAAAVDVGPLVPVWIDGDEPLLVLARRAQGADGACVQGMLVDWQHLQQELVALVGDLFDGGTVQLVRCDDPGAAEQPTMLASVPARLQTTFCAVVAPGLPITAILWTTWGVTLLGLLVLGFTLRAAIGYGERRARFASAVTHELRTPLTTFRMYSEMLADGMVKDPSAQHEYLETLQRESNRLARVVENVLVWSRLEEGRFTSRRERLAVGELLDRLAPTLGQRLGEVGMQLAVRVADDARGAVVVTDEDAVGQILFNLIDNAAKYARGATERSVELAATRSGAAIALRVRDHGPGIAPEHRQRVFVPFDRGAVPGSSNDVPGVGLGLALARGLARDLGGELRLDDVAGGGACFVLDLPCG